MRVLVVAPHPDDEVLGCGGVMARHANHGDDVYVAVVTRASPEVFPEDAVTRVRNELREAHDVLGVSGVRFLDFPAPKLDVIPLHALADAVSEVLHNLEPMIVYLPHHGDIHCDHGRVYHAAMVAMRPLPSCPVRKILCYETLSETEWAPPVVAASFVPTVFVEISAYLQQKLDAMACYRSQLKDLPYSRSLEGIKSLAQLRGVSVSVPFAEAFQLVREIDS